LDQLTARDIMQAEVVTIGPDATVQELADLLSTNKISGVPVIDDDGALVGVVTEGDIIVQDAGLHFPHYIQFLDSTIYLESVKKFEERFRRTFGTKVADVMSSEVVSVSPDASIYDVATLMADSDVNRVPVLEEGRLVGIITRADVVKAIASAQA
jgi:CBS domain-containing protein